jgi:hypothetical protein
MTWSFHAVFRYPNARRESELDWEELITTMMEHQAASLPKFGNTSTPSTEAAPSSASATQTSGTAEATGGPPLSKSSAKVAPAQTEEGTPSARKFNVVNYKALARTALAAGVNSQHSVLDWSDADFCAR